MSRRVALIAILAGAALRSWPLTENRFHPDEALYASFARLIAIGRDPMLASVVVDKPPLPFYLMAGSMYLLGSSELAARLPSILAGIMSVALVYKLASTLYNSRVGALAAVAFALSPFAILFSVTAFLDPLQTTLLLWTLLEMGRGHWRRGLVAFTFALLAKQTSLLFAPMLLTLVAIRTVGAIERRGPAQARLLLMPLLGLVAAVLISSGAITIWDAARTPIISLWSQAYTDNMPTRLVNTSEVWGRLMTIGQFLAHTTASPLLNVLGLVGLPLLFLKRGHASRRRQLMDTVLIGFTLSYIALYTFFDFNLWDRYFLPLVPLLCILLARVAITLSSLIAPALSRLRHVGAKQLNAPQASSAFALALVAISMTQPALRAAGSGYAIGGDHGAYDGIDTAASYLRELPKGAVLYDHWLSWQLRYYLDDAPIYLVWMPDAATLETDLRAFGATSPRYFVSPSWESDLEMQQAAQNAGFAFETALSTHRRDGTESFVVYRLVPIEG